MCCFFFFFSSLCLCFLPPFPPFPSLHPPFPPPPLFRSSNRRWMSLFALPSALSGGYFCSGAFGETICFRCWLALLIVFAARQTSIARSRMMGTSSLSWKGRIQAAAMATQASISRTSQGTSLPCKCVCGGVSPGLSPPGGRVRAALPVRGSGAPGVAALPGGARPPSVRGMQSLSPFPHPPPSKKKPKTTPKLKAQQQFGQGLRGMK